MTGASAVLIRILTANQRIIADLLNH